MHKSRLLNLGARKPHLLVTLDAIWRDLQGLRLAHTKLNHGTCPSVQTGGFFFASLFLFGLNPLAVVATVNRDFRTQADTSHRGDVDQGTGA
jgi:hypothetical protein